MSYSYDDAGRVTAIARGDDTVVYGYDGASRLTSRTLPLGVDALYVYNGASLVTSIAYSQGASTIGDITYSYDSDGLRNSVGGSLAATVLPDPVMSASYDVANRVTDWDGTPVTHDVNGNMTSFGEITYQWDDRGRLVVVDDPARDTTFGYDGLGRRSEVTVDGAANTYLHGGSDVAQRFDNTGTVTSSWLHGTGVDDHLAMYDDAGTGVYLTDALGSTIALVDDTGTITTPYGYAPFGEATVSGSVTSNPYTFTGRIDDGTGLMYYRARYLNPEMGRFISEDPIGIAGGTNLYSYVGNNPTNTTDPSGLIPPVAGACLGGAAIDVGVHALFGRKQSFGSYTQAGATGCAFGAAGFGIVKGIAKGLRWIRNTRAATNTLDDVGRAGVEATAHGSQRLSQAGFSDDLVVQTKSALRTSQAEAQGCMCARCRPGDSISSWRASAA